MKDMLEFDILDKFRQKKSNILLLDFLILESIEYFFVISEVSSFLLQQKILFLIYKNKFHSENSLH